MGILSTRKCAYYSLLFLRRNSSGLILFSVLWNSALGRLVASTVQQ